MAQRIHKTGIHGNQIVHLPVKRNHIPVKNPSGKSRNTDTVLYRFRKEMDRTDCFSVFPAFCNLEIKFRIYRMIMGNLTDPFPIFTDCKFLFQYLLYQFHLFIMSRQNSVPFHDICLGHHIDLHRQMPPRKLFL